MIHPRRWLGFALLLTLPSVGAAQARRDVHVIFKDGFYIKGIVNEKVRDVVWDPASGRPFPILSGQFVLDDHVRDIKFSPAQVAKIIQPEEFKPPRFFVRFDKTYQSLDIQGYMTFTDFGQWTDTGERTIQVDFKQGAKQGTFQMRQRVGVVSPQYISASTVDYKWNLMYFTGEFGPERTRKILLQIMREKKDYKKLSEPQKYLQAAALMHEAGWFKEAERDLKLIIDTYDKKEFPTEIATAEGLLAKVKKDRAELFLENVEQAAKVGQHRVALAGLETADREGYAKIVSPRHQRLTADLRTKYDKLKDDMAAIRVQLKAMPAHTMKPKDWQKACEFIAEELNQDTAGRLDEFLTSAVQFELERKNKTTLSLSAEKVMAVAISGWLQGNQAALPDVDAALKLAKARAYLLDYFKQIDPLQRTTAAGAFKRDCDLPTDVLARLLRMIPPPNPLEKLGTDVQTMSIEVPNSNGGSYLLQLPPDYHHQRSYPVLFVLHSGRDKPAATLERFSEEAAKYGFIVVAPQWAGKRPFGATYEPGKKHHDLILDTLRDLRWRLQVDSDRVFMFGWEDGGSMAFDVALGHPDLFAGVVPMNGGLLPFTRSYYWPNAQYLPFYIINGERDAYATQMRKLFEENWRRPPYNCLYVEYKGRAAEWYSLEVPKILDWMSRKKRYLPVKEMGQTTNNGRLGEEFRSTRDFENRFYWLRSDAIQERFLDDHLRRKWDARFRPATFQAEFKEGNKAGKGGDAKIWNQLNLRVSGLKQVTFLITPGMMDLTKPLAINVYGQPPGAMRMIQPSVETLLEELYQTGDRQRLYVAKVEIRP